MQGLEARQSLHRLPMKGLKGDNNIVLEQKIAKSPIFL